MVIRVKKMRFGIIILSVVNLLLGIMLIIQSNNEVQEVMSVEENMMKGKLAITFDDGPNPLYTGRLLEGLKSRNVKATFFVVGKKAEENPELIQRMQEDGHIIGNHTYSHIQLTQGNKSQFVEDIRKTNEIIKQITGDDVAFIRPPYGIWDKKYEKELNMFPVLWTVDPKDWYSQNADAVTGAVVNKVEENDIILLHDDYDTSVTAALAIIDILQKQGYQFVTVDEILFD